MFDYTQSALDPIQQLRKIKDGNPKKEESKKDEDLDELGGRGDDDLLEGELEKLPDDEKGEFSDIDTMFEKKLKNNEVNLEADAFEELLGKKTDTKNFQYLEDEARPEWEDLDTNQVIKEIQQKDVLSNIPQDKRTIFGAKFQGKDDIKQPKDSRFDEGRF